MKCLVLNYCALVKHSLEQVGNMSEERVSHGFIFVYILGSKYYCCSLLAVSVLEDALLPNYLANLKLRICAVSCSWL